MFKLIWTKLLFMLLTLGVVVVQAQICQPESILASTPNEQLQDNGNGTITDTKTGLTWKQCSEGQSGSNCSNGSSESFTWSEALLRAQFININGGFAGFTDWRVPNINELSSLVELQCGLPAINITRFPNTPAGAVYWSASAEAGTNDLVWSVYFGGGNTTGNPKHNSLQLRLVRSINSGPGIELIDDGTRTEPSDVDTTPAGTPIQPVSSEPLPAQGSTTVSGSVGGGLITSSVGSLD